MPKSAKSENKTNLINSNKDQPLNIKGSFDEVMNLAMGKPPKLVKKSNKKEDKPKK